jgi:uncharacterized protein YyaL (SSP411 family)
MAILGLLRLAAIAGRDDLREPATRSLECLGQRLRDLPQAVPHLLIALALAEEPATRIVFAGAPDGDAVGALLAAAHSVYLPQRILVGTAGEVDPQAKAMANSNRVAAFVCTAEACLPGVETPDELVALLKYGKPG